MPNYEFSVVQAAMVNWLEADQEAKHLVAAKYRDDDAHSEEVAFTRKLCPVRILAIPHVFLERCLVC